MHGIHSPFLFKFLKEAVYKTSLASSFPDDLNKEGQLILSIINYFQSEKIYLNSPSEELEDLCTNYLKLKPLAEIHRNESQENREQKFDTYLLNDMKSNEEGPDILQNRSKLDQSIVIIPHIRASKQQLDFFRSITQAEKGSVILEFYGFALIINRKESTSEYFRIRKW